jgi:hypothetical protein
VHAALRAAEEAADAAAAAKATKSGRLLDQGSSSGGGSGLPSATVQSHAADDGRTSKPSSAHGESNPDGAARAQICAHMRRRNARRTLRRTHMRGAHNNPRRTRKVLRVCVRWR